MYDCDDFMYDWVFNLQCINVCPCLDQHFYRPNLTLIGGEVERRTGLLFFIVKK
jgi:hypothetical protein